MSERLTPPNSYGLVRFVETLVGSPGQRMLRDMERCLEQYIRPDLEEKGLLGEHPLIAWNYQKGIWGQMEGDFSGSFFLIMGQAGGKIRGELSSSSSIQFAWRPNEDSEEVIISEVPLNLVVFRLQEEVQTPRVEFQIFNRSLLKIEVSGIRPRITVSPKSFPLTNQYLKPEFLEKVVITGNSQTLPQLPFGGQIESGQN